MTRNCPGATDHGGEDDRDHKIAIRSPAKRPLALAPFIVMTTPPLVKRVARSHIADREKASASGRILRPTLLAPLVPSFLCLLLYVSNC